MYMYMYVYRKIVIIIWQKYKRQQWQNMSTQDVFKNRNWSDIEVDSIVISWTIPFQIDSIHVSYFNLISKSFAQLFSKRNSRQIQNKLKRISMAYRIYEYNHMDKLARLFSVRAHSEQQQQQL